MEIYKLSVKDLVSKLKNKELSCTDIVRSFLERINNVEDRLKAFNLVLEKKALEDAKVIDNKIAKNEDLPDLAGIPIAIKDNICTEGILTTCSSKILSNFVPVYNATVYDKILQNNMILIGKTNMDEFAMGSSNENSAFSSVSNPWDLERVPGGSSGGSAVAVASFESPISLGSDTGGSIRLPASFCGLVGMKPTYGLVSRYGLIAFASSLDQIGPFSRNVYDNALLLNVIAGYDKKDSTSVNVQLPDYTTFLKDDIKGMKIAVPKEMFEDGLNNEVKESVENSLKKLEDMGANIEEISLPLVKYSLAAYYIIATAEASSNLARYDGVKYGYRTKDNVNNLEELYLKTRSEGFGEEVKRRIMLGTYVLSAGYYDAYYKKALQFRTLLINELKSIFSKYDVIVSPTVANTAFKKGEKSDPISMYLTDIMTVIVNLAGIPAISIPCGFDNNNLPIGIQFMANPLGEGTLYKIAYNLEKSLNLNKELPI
ncbi:MAG: glutamyl-tRNA(Gln) amidotransferase subunit A [Candidatus Sericytochromatia bacterium]|nr:MAG: glutamyl-tRNA(Gln) amidotransferase subunit A [Candidatus Sericytochromatia bacterium]